MQHFSLGSTLLFLIFVIITGRGEPPSFGNVEIKINQQSAQSYSAQNVIIYQDVVIQYDTTLHLQSDSSHGLYYYPQLHAGKNYVLHLLLNPQNEEEAGSPANFYDVFIDLGDTLPEQLTMSEKDSNTFLLANGQFVSERQYSKNQSGMFNLTKGDAEYGATGSFQTEFEYPISGDMGEYTRVSIRGDLEIPEANIKRGTATGISRADKGDNKFTRNLYIALITSIFIVLFALR